MFIVVVIGCDEDNTELAINNDGQWVVVDDTQSLAREITTTDTSSNEYPPEGYTPNDRVVAVKQDDFPLLTFFFAEVTSVDSVTINMFIPHNNVSLSILPGTLYKGADRQAGTPQERRGMRTVPIERSRNLR